jgi:hypothetical protein
MVIDIEQQEQNDRDIAILSNKVETMLNNVTLIQSAVTEDHMLLDRTDVLLTYIRRGMRDTRNNINRMLTMENSKWTRYFVVAFIIGLFFKAVVLDQIT